MNKDLGVLYKATDTQGHCYIGQHQGDGSDIGVTYFGSGKCINRVRKKHGNKYFTYWVFAKGLTKKERDSGEIYYIKFFQAREYQNGYNLTDGGEFGTIGYKHTGDAKKKVSKAHLGKKDSEETRQKKAKAQSVTQNLPEVKATKLEKWNNKSDEEKTRINSQRSESMLGKNTGLKSEEARSNMSTAQTIAQNKPEQKKKNSDSNKETWSDPKLRQNASENQNKAWANKSEEEKARIGLKQSRSQLIAQNKPEQKEKLSKIQLIIQSTPEAAVWQSKGGKMTNHIRWDVNRGIINPNCKLCMEKE